MCLSILVNHPEAEIEKGHVSGFEYAITHNFMGYRCGYLKLEIGHPWHGENYNNISPEVHGGLTFSEADVPCDLAGADNGWWIGFDCGHFMDAPDPAFGFAVPRCLKSGQIRSTEYVRSELASLALQAADANNKRGKS